MASPLKYTSKLQNKNVLVLGGTSGVGYSVAEAAIEHGANVTISGSNEPKLADALARLRQAANPHAARIAGKTCDLSDTAGLEANLTSLLAFATSDAAQRLDHVVFTAGDRLKVIPLTDATASAVTDAFAIRFVAPLILAKLLPRFAHTDQAASSLTLTGGVTARRPQPGFAVLAGLGSAVEGLMRGLAVELKPMRVNIVSLGAVKTEIFTSLPEDMLETIVQNYNAQALVGGIGRPEDVAEAYVYCMKDAFATGSVLETDGGIMLT
ncbi:short-chain dehydrogenase [Podospora appendiculata]|uniref:Short-chain dehydrogenase n=1 Tax=Podospora appendiculata TaxID=314037 RepID=A0AAE0XD95_9PEZI|nr:short-chain dehydrogenase [Podospora appendiculata]